MMGNFGCIMGIHLYFMKNLVIKGQKSGQKSC